MVRVLTACVTTRKINTDESQTVSFRFTLIQWLLLWLLYFYFDHSSLPLNQGNWNSWLIAIYWISCDVYSSRLADSSSITYHDLVLDLFTLSPFTYGVELCLVRCGKLCVHLYAKSDLKRDTDFLCCRIWLVDDDQTRSVPPRQPGQKVSVNQCLRLTDSCQSSLVIVIKVRFGSIVILSWKLLLKTWANTRIT